MPGGFRGISTIKPAIRRFSRLEPSACLVRRRKEVYRLRSSSLDRIISKHCGHAIGSTGRMFTEADGVGTRYCDRSTRTAGPAVAISGRRRARSDNNHGIVAAALLRVYGDCEVVGARDGACLLKSGLAPRRAHWLRAISHSRQGTDAPA